jgi:hypothetical protein
MAARCERSSMTCHSSRLVRPLAFCAPGDAPGVSPYGRGVIPVQTKGGGTTLGPCGSGGGHGFGGSVRGGLGCLLVWKDGRARGCIILPAG